MEDALSKFLHYFRDLAATLWTPVRCAWFKPAPPCFVQTEELLVKRRSLLEKKIAQELEKAKEYTKAQNKRGAHLAHPREPGVPLVGG